MRRRARGKGKSYAYLVKWRDRGYENATWEAEDDLPEGMSDWQKHVDAYWRRRKEHESGEKRRDKKPRKRDVSVVRQTSTAELGSETSDTSHCNYC